MYSVKHMSAITKKPPQYHSKLMKFAATVEKRSNMSDMFVKPNFKIDYINSGSTVLNMLCGGSKLRDGSFICPGYPRGRIIEIFGRESSGKSTLALTAMGQAVADENMKGCGLYIDLEHAVVDSYAQKLGCDFRPPEMGGPGNLIRAQPNTFEETEQLVTMAVIQGIDLIVIDSVAGLVSSREVARDVTKDSVAVAEIPRLMSGWMPKLQSQISKSNSCVIFLNQTRDKIGAMGYTEEALKSTVGGNALKFWAAIRLMLSPKTSMKAKVFNPILKEQEEVQIATDIKVKVIKNKIDAKQGHVGMISIRYGVGVDELLSMVNVAVAYEIVNKTKNGKKQEVFQFSSAASGRKIEEIGMEKFRLALRRDPESLQDMLSLAQEKIINGYKIIDDEQLATLAQGSVTTHNHDTDGDEDDDYAKQTPEDDVPPADYGDMVDNQTTALDITV